jgi:hypothetical protein
LEIFFPSQNSQNKTGDYPFTKSRPEMDAPRWVSFFSFSPEFFARN